MQPTVPPPPINFLNVGYFFQLLYNLFFSAHSSSLSGAEAFFAHLWLLITILAFLLTLILLGILIYYSLRLYEVVEEEDKKFETYPPAEAHAQVTNSRWTYIRQLIEGTQQSDWRNAIIEADIMLDEMLTRLGYVGEGVGEKLKTANPSHFRTLDDAWTAHRVRNDIAHRGSTYELSDHTAYQTIGRYENVFREFSEI